MSGRECSCCRAFLAFHLKFLNLLQTFAGVAIIIYSVWMLNQWNTHARNPPAAPSPQNSDTHMLHPDDILPLKMGIQMVSGLEDGLEFSMQKLPSPWFIYFFMGVGIVLCLVTCVGHIAAEAINGCCLCFYTLLVTVLMVLEGALVGFLMLDRHWKEDIPYDPTGELDRIRAFVNENIDICKWVGITVVIIQALSLLLALILRAIVSTWRVNYDSDDDYVGVRGGNRQPLLNTQGGQASGSTTVDIKGIHSDTWSARMRDKYGLNPADFIHHNNLEPSSGGEEQRRCCIL